MSKFTPGPWDTLAKDGFTVIGYMPIEPGGEPTMVVISDAPSSLPADVAKANARLIAAAPEMYEALTELDKMYSHTWDREDGSLIVLPDSVKRFDKAFEKLSTLLARINGDA